MEIRVLSPTLEFQNYHLIDLPSVNNEIEWYDKLLKDCFGERSGDNTFHNNHLMGLPSDNINDDDPEGIDTFLKE